jgi:hypothetical protein
MMDNVQNQNNCSTSFSTLFLLGLRVLYENRHVYYAA